MGSAVVQACAATGVGVCPAGAYDWAAVAWVAGCPSDCTGSFTGTAKVVVLVGGVGPVFPSGCSSMTTVVVAGAWLLAIRMLRCDSVLYTVARPFVDLLSTATPKM